VISRYKTGKHFTLTITKPAWPPNAARTGSTPRPPWTGSTCCEPPSPPASSTTPPWSPPGDGPARDPGCGCGAGQAPGARQRGAGGVGIYAVQIAAALGAEVTGVCSTRNAGLVRSIGAAHVVD